MKTAPLAMASVAVLGVALIGMGLSPKPPARYPSAPPVPEIRGRVYAQRVLDLHLGSADGEIVGRAHPGAVVEVVPVNDRYVRVVLPPARGTADDKPLEVFAEKSGFSKTFIHVVPPEFPPDSRILRGVFADELSTDEELKHYFGRTICGEVHVLKQAYGRGNLISQVFENVEIFGWTMYPSHTMAPSCNARRVEQKNGELVLHGGVTYLDEEVIGSIPPHFVKWDANEPDGGPDAFQRRVEAGATFFLLSAKPVGNFADVEQPRTAKGKCYEWKFARDADGYLMVRKETLIEDGKRAYASYGFAYGKQELHMFGPHYNAQPLDKFPKATSVGGYRCGVSGMYAGEVEGAVRIAQVSFNTLAWHPDDEERWYTTRAGCEAARAKYDAALEADPDARLPGNPHIDHCFGAFGERDEEP